MRPLLLFLFLILPPIALAEDHPLTRAEGFRMIWEPLNRPIEETREEPFRDVPDDHPDAKLLKYAKSRGILDDEPLFRPEEPLRLNDALLWLFRSRNAEEPGKIQERTLRRFVARFPLGGDDSGRLTRDDLARNDVLARGALTTLAGRLDDSLRNARHAVSYYGTAFDGGTTAFGERFNPAAMTAAHRTLPYNTLVRVTHHGDVNCQLSTVNCQTRSVVVRINDRGPFVSGRDMDLSRAAFERLSPKSVGVLTNVTFERLGDYATLRSNERSPRHAARLRRNHQE